MDSKSWLMYQLDSTKSDSTEEGAGKYSFPWLLKSLKFLYYIFTLLRFALRCITQAGRPPWPLWLPHKYAATVFPSRHLEWSTPWLSSLLSVKALVSFVLQHHQENPHGMGFFLLQQLAKQGSLQQLLTALTYSWQLILLVHLLAVLSYTHFPDHASLH